jgi:hypothetical protein
MEGEEEKRQFVVPKKEDIIEEIKNLPDDIEHISLNLIKCDFNATEKDVEKAFPDFHFIKVKKYNPGSFEVIFETRIDAINFIRNTSDKKILTRKFFIKLGRQQKEHAENWSAVGYVPRQFKQPFKKLNKPVEGKEEKGEEKKEETAEHKEVKEKPVEQPKPVEQSKPVEAKTVEHKTPAVQHKVEHKPAEHKPAEHKPAEHKPVEHKANEQKAADHKVPEKKAVEHKPVEHKPVEQKKVEHKPV